MAVIHCSTAELKKRIAEIHAGDEVFLSGTVYTARDAAHKRIRALLEAGEPLPFPLEGAVIYYAGPTPERPGSPIGSCGPDHFVPHGRIHAAAFGKRPLCHDRQRTAIAGGGAGDYPKQGRLFLCNRRRRRTCRDGCEKNGSYCL